MILWSQEQNYTELWTVSVPHIAPNWKIFSPKTGSDPMLYGRVSQDPVILEKVEGMVTDQNPELSDFEPSLAVIVTWQNNVSMEIGPPVRNCNYFILLLVCKISILHACITLGNTASHLVY